MALFNGSSSQSSSDSQNTAPVKTKATTKKSMNTSHAETVIGTGVSVEGTVSSESSIRVYGKVQGTVTANDTIEIGQEATVTGDLSAKEVRVSGTVNGNIKSDGRVTLQASAKLNGDVTCKTISIEEGAQFSGRCTAGTSASSTQQSPVRAAVEEGNAKATTASTPNTTTEQTTPATAVQSA